LTSIPLIVGRQTTGKALRSRSGYSRNYLKNNNKLERLQIVTINHVGPEIDIERLSLLAQPQFGIA